MTDTDRRREVKARFDPETFEQIQYVKRRRGLSWRAIILAGVAEVESSIPVVEEQLPERPQPIEDE
jgi:acetolactate synthase regulatory subunit